MKAVLFFTLFSALSSLATAHASSFPDAWVGKWTGPAKLTRVTGETKEFDMSLEIAKADEEGAYHWRIQYEGEPVRDYLLVEEDMERGLYVLDEQNGIYIHQQYLDGRFYSSIVIHQKLIEFVYELQDGKIKFTSPSYDVSASIQNLVVSMPFIGCQSALLSRKD